MKFENEHFSGTGGPHFAPFFDRALAFLLDSFIITAGLEFVLAAVFQKEPEDFWILRAVVFFGYFIVGHGKFGQTLGKKALQLRVIHPEGEELSLGRLILREVVGRIFNVITMGIGYMIALVAEKHQGLHDVLGGTVVVSESRSAASAQKVLLGGLAVFVIFGGVAYFVVMHTAVPLRTLAQQMELKGVKIQGIEGSLSSGVRIKNLQNHNKNSSMDFQDLEVSYDFYDWLTNKEEFVIQSIQVGQGTITVEEFAETLTRQKKPVNPQESVTQQKQKILERALVIKNVDINNLKVVAPDGKSYQLKRCFLQSLRVDEKEVRLERLWAESSQFTLNLGESLVSDKAVQLKKGYFYLQPTLHERVLRPIKGSFQVQYEKGKKLKGTYLSVFDNRLQLIFPGETVQLKTYDLSPGQYMKMNIPFRRISLDGNVPLKSFLNFRLNGTVYLRNKKAEFKDGRLRASQSKFRNRFKLNPFAFLKIRDEKVPLLVGRPNPLGAKNAREYLSDLYYSKDYRQLTGAQSRQVLNDVRFFHFQKPQNRFPTSR